MNPTPAPATLAASPLPAISDEVTPALFQLVYVSSATNLFSQVELIALLESSRQKNARAGLSGILLYHDGNFLQLLEGPEASVRSTYERIVRDPRHQGCLVLIKGPVTDRTFPDWTMGFRDFASDEVKAMPGYNGFLIRHARGDTFPTEPNRALTLLRTFRARLH